MLKKGEALGKEELQMARSPRKNDRETRLGTFFFLRGGRAPLQEPGQPHCKNWGWSMR